MSRKSFMGENVLGTEAVANRLLASLAQRDQQLHHVACVLHEQVGQILTVVGLQIDLMRQDCASRFPELSERALEAQQLLEKAIEEVRQLSYQLNPDIVQRSGLRYALDTLVGRFRESTSATIRLLTDSKAHLPPPVASAAFQIVELALDNAARHSQADLIEIVFQQGSDIRLEIRDNGVGFDVSKEIAAPRGLGLLWMRHRAASAGLELLVESRPGAGTNVKLVYRSSSSQPAPSPSASPSLPPSPSPSAPPASSPSSASPASSSSASSSPRLSSPP
ncbi:MAG: histidine kinase [Bryobacteraceae bacterium]|nr:histidine kinase [Bryobacteraceae bacterium]MDW8376797.1 histidine kinase [Bryobacterales bacterium]